jgi:hypothetical protein
MTERVICCKECGAPADTHIAGFRVNDVDLMLPRGFAYVYRERGKPLALCNLCFEAEQFDGFTTAEIAFFREVFAQQDATPDA